MDVIALTTTFIAFRRMCFARMRAIEQEANDLKKCFVELNHRLDAYESALTDAGENQAVDMWLKSLQFDENHRLIDEETQEENNEEELF